MNRPAAAPGPSSAPHPFAPVSRRVLLGAALAAPALVAGPARAQTVSLRSADIHPDGYPTVEAVKYLARLAEERSGGKLRIQVFHSHQLGEEKDTIEQTRFGVIDMNRINLGALNNLVPETIVPALPFLFPSTERMFSVLDGPVGDDIKKGFESHGMVGLAFYDSGARSFYNRGRPIRTPADMRGMKIRVQQSDMWLAIMRALGANATPLPFGEVYSALQTGVIDGAENNWPSYQTSRHFEVAKFYSLTEHSMSPEVLVMSKRAWDRLSPDNREILRAAAKESQPYMHRLWAEKDAEARRTVEAGGAQVNGVDKEAFVAAMGPVYEQFTRNARVKALVERVRAAG
ncbi:TRAP transporter substrate-binding protein [Roseomonas sp. NAR14]|uniref:TRAP transporter substrate-binding protein n=1 Tax=Roseomonas acroporae TaxID=2937791 RepID=A0A9X1YBX3_9PROT|nr:TRAP transporter substrate-binding protein [Roseomonas acroporae]MCK8785867.1 TRAP transporter substrate-binding protein [Roseomonas acroporae]